MVTFTLYAGGLTATTTADGTVHPDLMDELGRRCVRLFVEAYASMPEDIEEPGAEDA